MKIEQVAVWYKKIPSTESYLAGSDGSILSFGRYVHKVNRLGVKYKSRIKHRILKPWIAGYGYKYVMLGANGPKSAVHRFVCMAFHGIPVEGKEVAHLDGDCLNNRAENLAWVTHSENEKQKQIHGTAPDYGALRWGKRKNAG